MNKLNTLNILNIRPFSRRLALAALDDAFDGAPPLDRLPLFREVAGRDVSGDMEVRGAISISNRTASARTPLAPTRLSSIASSRRSDPAATPSAVSIRPSWWSPPLSRIPKAITRGANAIPLQPRRCSPSQSEACNAPISRPIQGANRAMRSKRGAGQGQAGSTE